MRWFVAYLSLLGPIWALLVAGGLVWLFFFFYRYRQSDYYRQTGLSYLRVRWNIGRFGEYETYRLLRRLPGYKRFLFNVYLPKEKDDETTELDVVLLHETGLYVFESKNYSGWIFGDENQQNWVQTLPTGRGKSQKNRFYNPIMQNKGHMKWLQAQLAQPDMPIFSYIVFSNRCTLKNVTVTSGQHTVVKREDLPAAVRRAAAAAPAALTIEQIDELYNKLYPLTCRSEAEKAAHAERVRQAAEQQKKPAKPAVQNKPEPAEQPKPQPSPGRCPRCGGALVKRTAGRGAHKGESFWGCEHYPHCRYARFTNNQPGGEA